MDKLMILKHIDHTLLKPYATWNEIQVVCDESIEFCTASVCIPPSYVKKAKDKYGEKINICTVIGFPLGYSCTESKVLETKIAIEEGANEIDMVINISDVKNGAFDKVEDEIIKIKEACGSRILKVIIEACYLDKSEKIKLCEIITRAKADFIKTSTGFGTSGASFEDIELFKKYVGKDVKIKAAGGIRTIEEIERYIELGCSRIGTSSAISLLSNL